MAVVRATLKGRDRARVDVDSTLAPVLDSDAVLAAVAELHVALASEEAAWLNVDAPLTEATEEAAAPSCKT